MSCLKRSVLLIVSIITVAGLAVAIPFTPSHYTNFYIDESDDGNLTYLTVNDDYKFDEYLKTGSTNLDELYAFLSNNVTCGKTINGVNPVNCSSFLVSDENNTGYYAGRNFDFRYSMPGVVFTQPYGGYSSVSTVDLRMFCNTDESFSDMKKDTRLNAVAYIPMDGINEKGVFICINSVNNGHEIAQKNEGKVSIFTTSALRLVLDNAATTEEAVSLISMFNLCSASDFHLFICDSTGDSRCVEYVNDVMYVTTTELLTNHYLTDKGDVPATKSSTDRFNAIRAALDDDDTMTSEQVKGVLRSVKQENPDKIHYTRWSVIYDIDTPSAHIYLRVDGVMDYSKGYAYDIHGY